MQDKMQQIKNMLHEAQQVYDNYSIKQNGIVMHDRVEKSKFLHARIVTLKDVIKILEA